MKPRDALLAAAAALFLLILVEWIAGSRSIARIDAPVPATAAAAPARNADAVQTAATPEEVDAWLATILARPLMTPSRAAAAKTGGPALALDGGLPRLAGILTGDGTDLGANTAVFARGQTGKPLILHAGAALGPYRIVSIVPGGVTLDGPDGRQVVHPSFGPPGSATVADGEPGVPNGSPGFVPSGFPQPTFPPPNFPGPNFPAPNSPAPNFPGLVPQPGPNFTPGRTE